VPSPQRVRVRARFNAVRDWAACTTATIVWPKDVQFGSSFEGEPRPRRDDINSVRRSLLTLSGPSIPGPVINQGFLRRFQRKDAALHFGEAQQYYRFRCRKIAAFHSAQVSLQKRLLSWFLGRERYK
jgi:hypothetical protein